MIGDEVPSTSATTSSSSPWPSEVKIEPMDQEDRNDSGINSGSDHSSSPASNPGETNYQYPNGIDQIAEYIRYHANPLYIQNQTNFINGNPSTLNSLPVNMSPSTDRDNPTPSTSAELSDIEEPSTSTSRINLNRVTENFQRLKVSSELARLQRLVPDNNILVPDNNILEMLDGEPDEKVNAAYIASLRERKKNSHGKLKVYRCKNCKYTANTKWVYWEHTVIHLNPEKRMDCPRCPFTTDLKHHMVYHTRNHYGYKPYKCEKCNYSCVNKSMLNSHLKSHSDVYQYKCADCSYASKYCHSLKLHLRKYKHQPAMVLNPDGTPNPLPIIDVYGTRRGPKLKVQERKPVNVQKNELATQSMNRFMLPPQLPPLPPLPFFPGFTSNIPNQLLLHNFEQLAIQQVNFAHQATLQAQAQQTNLAQSQGDVQMPSTSQARAWDLSKPEKSNPKRRRKGQAVKRSPVQTVSSDDEYETTMFSNVEVVHEVNTADQEPINYTKKQYSCEHCSINFGDAIIYNMHMGYHGFNNPFTCNRCGEECDDKVAFFMHIARIPHP